MRIEGMLEGVVAMTQLEWDTRIEIDRDWHAIEIDRLLNNNLKPLTQVITQISALCVTL